MRALRGIARSHGAGEAELAAIDRLEAWTAERVDLDRLAPLARLAGLPWEALFPELQEGGSP